MKIFFCTSLAILSLATMSAQDDSVIYKKIDTLELSMHIYKPMDFEDRDSFPAIIFFFGGGWRGGTPLQFDSHAKYFSSRGMVCFLADYRVFSRHATDPGYAVKDAKSAIRYLRSNADELNINATKIVAAGGSAGGHLAAATALLHGYNDPMDSLQVDCMPNALVLFNPVIDNGPSGYGYERVSDAYHQFSPLHNIRRGAPPTLFMVGDQDDLIPVETARYFQMALQRVGSTCELIIYPDARHGFFNKSRSAEHYKATVTATDRFLQRVNYISTLQTIKIN